MKLLILAVFLTSLRGTALGGTEESNLDFLFRLADSVVAFPGKALGEEKFDYVLLSRGDSANSLNWLIQSRLIDSFEKTSNVYIRGSQENQDSPPNGIGAEIEFVPLSHGITYSESDSLSPDGESLVERRGHLTCAFLITRPGDGRVLWRGEGKGERLDYVARSKISTIEGEFSYTKGEWSDERIHRGRWKQALLVSTVTGLIVYLFYSIRSR